MVIWTTTPWTLPANLAVAYNQDFQYVLAKVGAEKFLVHRGLLPAVAGKCGWTRLHRSAVPRGGDGRAGIPSSLHPRAQRPVVAGGFVTADTGTGFVHIAPGHGQDDYNLGPRQRSAGVFPRGR